MREKIKLTQTNKQLVVERIENLASGHGKTPISEVVEKLKKNDEINSIKKSTVKNNGGARKGAGRKSTEAKMIERGLKNYIGQYYEGDIKINVIDPKTGREIIVKKPRIIWVLEVLYDIGVKDRNADALNKWLDRALGKPTAKIEHSGNIQNRSSEFTPEIQIAVKQYEEIRNRQILEESKKKHG